MHDVLLIFFFLASGFFYGVFFGRARLLALLLGVYIGVVISFTAPLESFSNTTALVMFNNEYAPIVVFFISVFIGYYVVYSSILRGRRLGDEKWWHVFLLGFLTTGFIVSAVFRLLPSIVYPDFMQTVELFFLSDIAYIGWFLGPLVAIYIAGKRTTSY